MSRITRKQVDTLAERLCTALNLPEAPYTEVDGRYEAQVGCIHIISQNGSHNVYQMCNEAGGCRGLAYGLTLRECDTWLRGALEVARLRADN